MKKKKPSNKKIVDAVLAAYRSNPNEFANNFPEISCWFDELCGQQTYGHKSPFGLTEHEKELRIISLKFALEELKKCDISTEQATQALEDIATLIIDESLPDDVDHEVLVKLIKIRIGIPLKIITEEKEYWIPKREEELVSKTCSVIRGVELALTWDNRLIKIFVNPTKIQERSKALSFVGILSSQLLDEGKNESKKFSND